jgi:hypothetical protein
LSGFAKWSGPKDLFFQICEEYRISELVPKLVHHLSQLKDLSIALELTNRSIILPGVSKWELLLKLRKLQLIGTGLTNEIVAVILNKCKFLTNFEIEEYIMISEIVPELANNFSKLEDLTNAIFGNVNSKHWFDQRKPDSTFKCILYSL